MYEDILYTLIVYPPKMTQYFVEMLHPLSDCLVGHCEVLVVVVAQYRIR